MTELLVLNDGKQEMQAVSLDGTRVRTLITGLEDRPDGIVVDQSRGHVYWTNMGAPDPGAGPRSEVAYARNGSLERADLNGTNRVTIVPRGAFTTGKQLAADFEAGVLYWCDREGMQVLSCNLDGSDLRPLVVPAVGDEAARTISNHPVGIAIDLDRRLLYWTQKGAPKAGEGRIFRASLDLPPGADPQHRDDIELLWKDLPEPIDLHLFCSVGPRWCGLIAAQNPRATRSTARSCSPQSVDRRSFLADTTRRSASPPSRSPSSTSAIWAAASATSTLTPVSTPNWRTWARASPASRSPNSESAEVFDRHRIRCGWVITCPDAPCPVPLNFDCACTARVLDR